METPVQSYEELLKVLETLKPDNMESMSVVTITPDLAKEILAHDPINRGLKPGKVDAYAREQLANRWMPSRSAPLAFIDKQLADGQHRLHSIMQSGIPMLCRLISVTETLGVDECTPRRLPDYIARAGGGRDKETSQIASEVTRAICDIRSPSNQEQLDTFIKDQTFILECVTKAEEWVAPYAIVRAAITPNLLAIARAVMIRKNNVPEALVDELLTGVANKMPEGSYAAQIHAQCVSDFANKTKRGRVVVLKQMMTAIDLMLSGKKVANVILAAKKKARKPGAIKKTSLPFTPQPDAQAVSATV